MLQQAMQPVPVLPVRVTAPYRDTYESFSSPCLQAAERAESIGKRKLEDDKPKKRKRKKYYEVERFYKCNFPNCSKAYGTLGHLNCHILRKKHGKKRLPSEFKEMRERLEMRRKQKEEEKAWEEERQRIMVRIYQALPPIKPQGPLQQPLPPFSLNMFPAPSPMEYDTSGSDIIVSPTSYVLGQKPQPHYAYPPYPTVNSQVFLPPPQQFATPEFPLQYTPAPPFKPLKKEGLWQY